jgi:hypothetical protein
MALLNIIEKIKIKLYNKLLRFIKNTNIYPYIYKSYWHYLFNKGSNDVKDSTCFFGARPNPGAGIGHQLANWIAGYWFAKQFELKFVHLPFSTSKWENFLGFGEGEANIKDLKRVGYKTRKLPLFKEDSNLELSRVKAIIRSYSGKKIIFIAEQDQFYKDQYGIMDELKYKFNHALSRKFDKIVYDPNYFNIAVHVRRTVIIDGKIIVEDEAAQSLRWLSNNYYEKVLQQVVQNIKIAKPLNIYIFSTGDAQEFVEFSKYGHVRFCSDMDEYTSFLHLIRADLLITSKSSFSYKPALINDSFKICPRNFWHSYPSYDKKWILAENDGTFDIRKLSVLS